MKLYGDNDLEDIRSSFESAFFEEAEKYKLTV